GGRGGWPTTPPRNRVDDLQPMNAEDISRFSKTVDANGLSFPVFERGSGPAVLLLHGFPDSRFLWRHQIIPLLDAGFRVVAPDLRGFGDAPRPAAVEEY